MLDESEFLSPHGIRALSRFHMDHPYVLNVHGMEHRVDYQPAESKTSLFGGNSNRSEEHTSELQSRLHLVCRLLLEKKKNKKILRPPSIRPQHRLSDPGSHVYHSHML